MDSADFSMMFLSVFGFIYGCYMKYAKYFRKVHKQLLTYEKNTKKVYMHGYIGDNQSKMEIDHFQIEGQYKIKVNGNYLRVIIDGSIDTFDPNVSYFLTSNNVWFEKNVTIEVEEVLLGDKKALTLDSGIQIDYKRIVSELF